MSDGVAIVVLAAGGSERLGRPKQSLEFRGASLLGRAAAEALASHCRPVVVVLGSGADALRAEVPEGAHVVVNEAWADGMGGSVRVGVDAVEAITVGRASAVVVALCDQPFVTAATIDRLVEAYEATRPLAVASEFESEGATTRGAPALFDRRLFAELTALSGGKGARLVLAKHAAEVVAVAAPEAAFDVDTPADADELATEPGAQRPAVPRAQRRV